MSMHSFNFTPVYIILVSSVLLFSCTKKQTETSYEIKPQRVYSSEINKFKLKTEAQYLSILNTDLTQLPMSPARLNRAVRVLESFGDRETANEIIISNIMNDPNLSIPPDAYMREHTEQFIIETYNRFFVRNPSQAELAYFLNFIESNNKVTVEMVYTAFASSNEYMFY